VFFRVKEALVVLLLIVSLVLCSFLCYDRIFDVGVDRLIVENIRLKSRVSFLEGGIRELKERLRSVTSYEVTVTFYTPRESECDATPFKNALNKRIVVGRDVAVSRDLMHLLGKYIYIEGYGVKKVVDLMDKRYTRTVDILVSSPLIAKTLGKKKNVKVKLILLSNYWD